MKLELRAMTKSHLIRERPVMMSSTIPSAKYSCSGSPLIFVNGSTASDGWHGERGRVPCDRFGTFTSAFISDGRSDIAVAAARQCLNPIFAAGFFRKGPSQRGNLDC